MPMDNAGLVFESDAYVARRAQLVVHEAVDGRRRLEQGARRRLQLVGPRVQATTRRAAREGRRLDAELAERGGERLRIVDKRDDGRRRARARS